MYDVENFTRLWIAAFWTMLICNSCWTSAAVVWLLHRQFRAILRGDRDIDAPQPAELRHGDAIKHFQLRHEEKKRARPRSGYVYTSLIVFTGLVLTTALYMLTNSVFR